MNKTAKSALKLAAVAAASGLVLALVYSATKGKIEKLESQTGKKALESVLPQYTFGGEKIAEIDGSEFHYWEGLKNENGTEMKGYAFISQSNGYSGTIKTMVGVDASMKISAIVILKQTETPGLGARATEVASKYSFIDFVKGKAVNDEIKPWFERQFEGIDLNRKISVVKKGDWKESMKDELAAGNEVSAITGATITTNAVRKGIEDGFAKLKKIIPAQVDTESVELPEVK